MALQIKRGNKTTMPDLLEGELGYCMDVNQLYIGSTDGNVEVAAPISDDVIDTVCILDDNSN